MRRQASSARLSPTEASPREAKDREAKDDLPRGIAYALGAVFLFSLLNVVVKWQSARYPVGELVFFRSVFSLPPLALLIWRAGGRRVIATSIPGKHVFRALIWFSSIFLTFAAFQLLPLADAVALGFSAPLFLTALSAPVLGEKVGRHRWGAVILGFLGVLVMTRPGMGMVQWGAFCSLGGALLFAIGSLTIRQMSRTEPSLSIVFYTMAVGTVLSAALLPFIWVPPSAVDFAVLIFLGIGGGLSQLCQVQAYRYAPVSAVAPFNYAQILFAVIFGFILWGDLPDGPVVAGSLIVIASGFYIIHRETLKDPLPLPLAGEGRGEGTPLRDSVATE
jgi:drug/metabolite transporter (DMT)-like permease